MAVTVAELLRLAPFSLGTITIMLAAGGALFGHAYGRYGDDATMGFLMRARFGLAAVLILPIPVLMLVSFGAGKVPTWLTEARAAILVGLGLATTVIVVAYWLISVGRPHTFLRSVGRRVGVSRVNRYARARHWADPDEFAADVDARVYQWSQRQRKRRAKRASGEETKLTESVTLLNFGTELSRSEALGRRAITLWMHARRLALKTYRTDPSELLFDAAATGLGNGSMRTWRAALEVLGRRLQSRTLEPLAAGLIVANALVLEEAAHGKGSEDCKVRLAFTLGEIGNVPLPEETAGVLANGTSTLAERRLLEQRPVLAVIEALRTMADSNPIPVVKALGWLGQHLMAVPPPPPAYGFDSYHAEHPTKALFALLSDIADRANRDDVGELNDVVIDACDMISRSAPGAQDRETLDVLAMTLSTAGESSAQRYGAGKRWHGTLDAATALHRLYDVSRAHVTDSHSRDNTTRGWIVESIVRIGAWALGAKEPVHIREWSGRSDMGVLLAQELVDVPLDTVSSRLMELLIRQHNEGVPRERREEFIGICQRLRHDLLGFRRQFDVPGLKPDD